jgi:hypothetical protein
MFSKDSAITVDDLAREMAVLSKERSLATSLNPKYWDHSKVADLDRKIERHQALIWAKRFGLPLASDGYQDGSSFYRAYFVPSELDPTGLNLASCLRACDGGSKTMQQFCRGVPHPAARAACWAVSLVICNAACKGFCYAWY